MGGALTAQPYLDRQIPCRRFMLVGDKDSGCIEGAGKPVELQNANCVECRIDILEDVGHEYTDGFQQYVEALLSFLLE